jgi:hypothetical protein
VRPLPIVLAGPAEPRATYRVQLHAGFTFEDAARVARRFFDIHGLVGLRSEDPRVFPDTHALVVGWVRAGVAQGLRIDHVDGLADPEGYLDLLRHACPETWIVVEKILGGHERLPARWPVAGTTGYDFLTAHRPGDGEGCRDKRSSSSAIGSPALRPMRTRSGSDDEAWCAANARCSSTAQWYIRIRLAASNRRRGPHDSCPWTDVSPVA